MTDDDERFSQDAISRLTPVEPSARLQRIVAQIPISHPRQETSWWPFQSVWLPSLSLAATAIFGVLAGESWHQLRTENAPVAVHSAQTNGQEPSYEDLDTDHLTAEFSEEIADPDLETLLVIATTGDFESGDWDLTAPSDRHEETKEVY